MAGEGSLLAQEREEDAPAMRSADEANRQYFRDAYRTGEHGWAGDQPSPYAVEFLKRVRHEAPSGRLLDLGCGQGRHAIIARTLGFRVVGVDYEPLALRNARRSARREGVKGIAFRQADILDLPFRARSFDIVLDYGCLHHQKKADWAAYRRSVLRVLKPRGYFLLSVFSPRFRFFAGSRRRWHIACGAYRRCFTLDDIRRLFGPDFEFLDQREERGGGRGFWHVLMRRRPERRRSSA